MVTEALLQLVVAIAASLVSLIPSVDWDTSDFQQTTFAWGSSLGGFNNYFPVTAVFGAVALLLAVWLSMALWNGVVWVYHQFWGSD